MYTQPKFGAEHCWRRTEKSDRTGYVSFYIEYAPPPFSYHLFNTVYRLTPLIIVDFLLSAIHRLDSMLLVGVADVLRWWGEPDCCCIAGCT